MKAWTWGIVAVVALAGAALLLLTQRDPLAVATVSIAVGTLALAAVTFYLVLEARQSRIQSSAERHRTVLRAAIFQQADDCRRWFAAGWALDDAQRLPEDASRVRLVALERLLGEFDDLPSDLASYLIWFRAKVEGSGEAYAREFRPDDTDSQWKERWYNTLDGAQVFTGLLDSYARSRDDLDRAARTTHTHWTRIREFPASRVTRYGSRDAPSFPVGEHFDACKPDARDAVALRDHGPPHERTMAHWS